MHSVHILHIVPCILCILCIFWMEKSFAGFSLFIATTAWSPIPGPSFSRTTTYNHHHSLLIYRKKIRERQPILVVWRRVSSWSLPLEEEGVPVWRTLESHTGLGIVHGARRQLQVDTRPPRMRLTNKSGYVEYVKYAKYAIQISKQNMQINMQINMHNMQAICRF